MQGPGVDRLHHLVRGARRAEVRDRRSALDRIRRVHLDVAAGDVTAGAENPAVRDDGGAGPVQVARVGRRGLPLCVRHGGPRQPEAVILEVPHERVVAAQELHAVRVVDEREEPEPVADLVQDDGDEIDLAARRIAVEAVVPGVRKRARRAERAVELRADVGLRREVRAAELVRERLGVPRVRDQRAGEVGVYGRRASLAEHRARGAARERVHRRRDGDRHRAHELGGPHVGRVLEGGEPLGTERRRDVPAHRCDHGRIVEAFARIVGVDDGDGRGASRAEGEQEREHAPEEPARHHSGDWP